MAIRDHPRMCGEHQADAYVMNPLDGSSPHVRGALVLHSTAGELDGIIPACAGSTRIRLDRRLSWRDHPRMCGEHGMALIGDALSSGSSPHVRGAPVESFDVPVQVGIIPACAGSTCLAPASRKLTRDHPRMCGEHDVCVMARVLATGSSPHVRGAPAVVVPLMRLTGIIPACAGSTSGQGTDRR